MSAPPRIPNVEARVRSATEVRAPPLCPEIRLHLKPDVVALDAFRASHETVFGLGTPYWSIAWPGGQALARYLLDHPEAVRGRTVLDLGGGSGLAAIAARRAGAARAVALDRDPTASKAAALNADLNAESIGTATAEAAAIAMNGFDLVLAGDLWYDRFDGRAATGLLRRLSADGKHVLLGDVGRACFPRSGLTRIAAYALPADLEMEQAESVIAGVYRFASGPRGYASGA